MKLKIGFGILGLLLLNIVNAYAQGDLPCDGGDIDNPCPLDTWVMVLVVPAVLFAVFHLYRQQKSAIGPKRQLGKNDSM